MVRLLTLVYAAVSALLLALAAAAVADPVTVTTRSSGFIDANPGAVYHLGIDLYEARAPLPYNLTIGATFDPAADGFLEGERTYWTPDAAVALRLQIGTDTYRYDGTVSATTSLRVSEGGSGYEQEIGLIPLGIPRWVTFVSNTLDAPVGSGGLFAPRTLSLGPGQGVMRIATFLDDPDAPSLSWAMRADADAMSLQVVSGVPEPAPACALALGLGMVGWWRRRR